MICLTQSLGSPWGSTVVIPGTGVCMNNFMYWGDLNPASPNHLVGGQRWAMCLSPSISLKDDQAVLALGTPGSYGIMQTQAQAFVHYADFGLNLRQAIEAPRARLFDGKEVVLESRVANKVTEELKRRGHDIKIQVRLRCSVAGCKRFHEILLRFARRRRRPSERRGGYRCLITF